jgi:hypothetical protein
MILSSLSPMVLLVFGYREKDVNKENRRLQTELVLKGKKIREWPQNIDAWFNDTIPWRTEFIDAYISAWDRLLQSSVGFYIKGYSGNHYAKDIEPYLGLKPLNLRKLCNLKYNIASTQAYCQIYGISYFCFFVPDKESLYPEFLPFYCNNKGNSLFVRGISRREQLIDYFRDTPLNFIDLTQVLVRGKNKGERMYHDKIDPNHWNGLGASVGYQKIREVLRSKRPDLLHIQNKLPYKISRLTDSTVNEDMLYISYLHPGEYRFNRDAICEITPSGASYIPKDLSWGPWKEIDYAINMRKEIGRLCLVSDSYFKASINGRIEGAKGRVFPLIDDFHEYLHLHYDGLTPKILQEICQNYKPDFFVGEFAEHQNSIYRSIFINDSYMLSLADFLLQTSSAEILTPQETPLASLASQHASWTEQGDSLVFHSQGVESHINTDTPPILIVA